MARWWLAATAALLAASCSPAEPQAAPVAAVPPDVATAGAIVVATDASFPPAQLPAPTGVGEGPRGELTGFEVELVEAAADRLGLEVEWRDVPFEQVLPALLDGDADMAAAAITITPERAVDVDFVPFFRAGTQWATLQPNTRAVLPGRACGARVVVQAGTVQERDVRERSARCVQAGRDPIDVAVVERQDEAAAAVLQGRADALVADQPAVAWAVRQAGSSLGAAGTGFGGLQTAGPAYDVAPYGWGFAPGEALDEAMATALAQVVADGEYEEILRRWGVQDGALAPEELGSPAP